ADLAKKTGFILRLEGDRAKLAQRRISLETGEIPFWEALALLCEKAGLVEREPPPAPRANPKTGLTGSGVGRGGGRGRRPAAPADVMRPANADRPTELVLAAGKPGAPPTSYAGALRVTVPPFGAWPAQVVGDGETRVVLDVKPQPTLNVPKIVGVRITKAVD